MVQHLTETGSTYYDSTYHNNDGTRQGNLQADYNGRIGTAANFDGTNDYIDLGTTTDFDRSELTISAWIKTTHDTTDMRIAVGGEDYTNKWHLIMDDSHLMITQNTLSGQNIRTVNTYNDGQWHHVLATRNPLRIYVDGQLQNANPYSETWSLNGNPKIGAKSSSQYFFNGLIDEVRIIHDTLTTGWIQTEYQNQKSPTSFISVGIQESRGPMLYGPTPANGATNQQKNPSLTIYAYHPLGHTMTLTFQTNATGSWHTIKTLTNQHNGSKSCTPTTMNTYQKKYYWRITATDGTFTTTYTYTFTTMPDPTNYAPTITNPEPSHQATNIPTPQTTLTIILADQNNDPITWSIETSPNIGSTSNTNTPGTKTLTISNLKYSTTYTWYVNVTDGKLTTKKTYTFTTKAQSSGGSSGGTSGGSYVPPPPEQITPQNSPPNKPLMPATTTTHFIVNTPIEFSTSTTDDNNDQIRFEFTWGDGTTTLTTYSNPNTIITQSHTWTTPGAYHIKVRAEDTNNTFSDWSPTKTITIQPTNTTPPQHINTIDIIPQTLTGNTITLTPILNNSINKNQITYHWDFGDGTTDTTATPEHTYKQPGNYTITLTIETQNGTIYTTTYTLEVTGTSEGTPQDKTDDDHDKPFVIPYLAIIIGFIGALLIIMLLIFKDRFTPYILNHFPPTKKEPPKTIPNSYYHFNQPLMKQPPFNQPTYDRSLYHIVSTMQETKQHLLKEETTDPIHHKIDTLIQKKYQTISDQPLPPDEHQKQHKIQS
ncbi:MAG: PKD domain-containing protein [Candidatus Thermoplasmatota archaeon]|nr:PKD domain-containing protein [Candidatus Thermoplasmatota archaeon]